MFNVILLGLTSLFTDISSEMIYPLIGMYLALLGAPATVLGLVEGIAESTASLLKVFGGIISDRWQRRKGLVIAGYSTSLLSKIILGLSRIWPVVLIARFSDRLGKGLRNPARDALIYESSPAEKLGFYFGLHRFLDTLGASLGVLITYFLLEGFATTAGPTEASRFRQIFLLASLPALIGVIILFWVKENPKISPKSQTPKNNLRQMFSSFRALPLDLKRYLVIFLVFSLFNSSNQFLLLRARTSGISPGGVVLVYLLFNLVYAFSSWPAGFLSDIWGRKNIMAAGYLIFGLVYLGFATKFTFSYVVGLFALYGIYYGLTEGIEKAYLSEKAPPDIRASVLGLQAFLGGVVLFPASFFTGLLWDKFGPAVPFTITGLISIISGFLIWKLL